MERIKARNLFEARNVVVDALSQMCQDALKEGAFEEAARLTTVANTLRQSPFGLNSLARFFMDIESERGGY